MSLGSTFFAIFSIALTTDDLPVQIDSSLFPQKKVWTYGADFKLNFSLANTSPNWSGGSGNNINLTGLINANANLRWHRLTWDNLLKANVGVIANRQEDISGQTFLSTRKNVDNLFIDSKLGMDFEEYPTLSMYGGLNFQTQLLPGYTYTKDSFGRDVAKLNTSFLSQGQTQFALGTENKFYRNYFLRLGYITLKQTYVLNQELYDLRNQEIIARVSRGAYIDNEFGMQIQIGGTENFGKEDMFTAKFNYLGFLPYQTKQPTLDSRLDIGLSARITKYLSLNYNLIAIFDKDLVPISTNAWQNSWVFGVAYGYHL